MTSPPAGGGTLFVVGTPIGNLDDLSPRAIAALRDSRAVACEDTRTTRGLMRRFGLATRLVSYHRFNEAARAPELLALLDGGAAVALVTDGGTPGISDPGALLVSRARAAGHRIVPIPGPSAVTALLSVCGFPPGPFTFVGFLPPRRGERRRALQTLGAEPRPLLFFEAPHRLAATLDDLRAAFGDRRAFLGREMTKLHEEFLEGPLSEIACAFAGRRIRGEIALLVEGAGPDRGAPEAAGPDRGAAGTVTPEADQATDDAAAAVERLVQAGADPKEAMRRVARERGLTRREVYGLVLRRAGRGPRRGRPGERKG